MNTGRKEGTRTKNGFRLQHTFFILTVCKVFLVFILFSASELGQMVAKACEKSIKNKILKKNQFNQVILSALRTLAAILQSPVYGFCRNPNVASQVIKNKDMLNLYSSLKTFQNR